jgi:serpin B
MITPKGRFMKTLITSIAVSVLFTGFVLADPPRIINEDASQYEVMDLVAAQNDFGFKLLRKLNKEGENTFISPTSISIAFAMIYNGTTGDVRKEFREVLGWGGLMKPENFNSANKELITQLRRDDLRCKFEIANSVWLKKGFDVNPVFKEDNMKFFKAEVNSVPFNKETVKRINDWVSRQTDDKISRIIDDIDADERVLLFNTVYFKGLWQEPFEATSTEMKDFYYENRSKVPMPLMSKYEMLEYYQNSELQAVRLPFGNGDMAMTFILPLNKLSTFQKRFNLARFQAVQKGFKRRMVNLKLPRFKVDFRRELKPVLKEMGLEKSFELSKGFARINPDQKLRLSTVIHQTVLQVRESGAEAAATTMLGADAGGEPPKVHKMTVNRPFLCAISSLKRKNVIFLGAIYKPEAIMEEIVSAEINEYYSHLHDVKIDYDKMQSAEIDDVLRSKAKKSGENYEWHEYGIRLSNTKSGVEYQFLFKKEDKTGFTKEFNGGLRVDSFQVKAETSVTELRNEFKARLIREADKRSYYILIGPNKVRFVFGEAKELIHVSVVKNNDYIPPKRDGNDPFDE